MKVIKSNQKHFPIVLLAMAALLLVMVEITSSPLRSPASANTTRPRRMTNEELRRDNEALQASALGLASFQMEIDALNPDRYANWTTLLEDISNLRNKISSSLLSKTDRKQLLEELELKKRSLKSQFPDSEEPGLLSGLTQ